MLRIKKYLKPLLLLLSILAILTFLLDYAIVRDKENTYTLTAIKGFEALAGFKLDINGSIHYQQPSILAIICLFVILIGVFNVLLSKKNGDMLAICFLLSIVSGLAVFFQNNEYGRLLQKSLIVKRGIGSYLALFILVTIILITYISLKSTQLKLVGNPWFWLFIGPCLIALCIVVVIPTIIGLFYSFTTWDGINEMQLTGLTNFKDLIKDKLFWQSFGFTARFAAFAVVFINVTGLALAMLVTSKFAGRNALRTTLYVPNLIGGLILGYIWNFIFVDAFAALGELFKIKWLYGWLSTTETGFWGLLILSVWQMAGYMMVIYIAYLENVPEDLLEAARIDGASKSQVFWHIVIPMIIPAFTINTFLTLSNSFKLFDQNLALTNGTPGNTTQMLALNIYRTAFAENKMAYAQAKALVFFLIVGALSLAQVYFSKKKEVEV